LSRVTHTSCEKSVVLNGKYCRWYNVSLCESKTYLEIKKKFLRKGKHMTILVFQFVEFKIEIVLVL